MEGDMIAFLSMVIVQMGYAGMNIISKLAMDSGMNPFVHVAYRQLFATLAIAPFAYFVERYFYFNFNLIYISFRSSLPTIYLILIMLFCL